MARTPFDPFSLVLKWSVAFLFLSALCVPNYFVVRQARKGVLGGMLSFWLGMTAALFLIELAGEDMDPAPGCYLVAGWLVGLMYCLPALILIEAWRAWHPNPGGYCKTCGRAVKLDQIRCPAGHFPEGLPRGFEVLQASPQSNSL
jgi:hypothetical protein